MQIRRFSPDLKVKIPGNHPGLRSHPVQARADSSRKVGGVRQACTWHAFVARCRYAGGGDVL